MPEFAMSEPEAEGLATAILNYTRHLHSSVDPKTRDFYAMLIALGTVEGIRVVRVSMRKKLEKAAAAQLARQRAEAAGQIVNMGR